MKPLRTVLRTNLAGALTPGRFEQLLGSVDQIVVSVDGDEFSHDARRGVGAYARTVANLRAVLRSAAELRSASAAPPTDIAIAAVLDADQMEGREGRAVRALGGELHLSVRLKPLLPLGRAADERPRLGFPGFDGGGDGSLASAAESLACGARVAATCGLGMNLSIDPAGECFPCYALEDDEHRLGNVLSGGLGAVLARNDAYRSIGVDTDAHCRRCAVRYICGGMCRAWRRSDDAEGGAPLGCAALQRRAQGVLEAALETLRARPDRCREAGLLLAASPVGGGDQGSASRLPMTGPI